MNNKFPLLKSPVCLRACLYTVLEKCRLPSRWPHYEGRQGNQVIALGKWRGSILKSRMGTHKKEQMSERRKIKMYRIVKTSRKQKICGSAVVPTHRLENSYFPPCFRKSGNSSDIYKILNRSIDNVHWFHNPSFLSHLHIDLTAVLKYIFCFCTFFWCSKLVLYIHTF